MFMRPILEYTATCYSSSYRKSNKLIEGFQKYLVHRLLPNSNITYKAKL